LKVKSLVIPKKVTILLDKREKLRKIKNIKSDELKKKSPNWVMKFLILQKEQKLKN